MPENAKETYEILKEAVRQNKTVILQARSKVTNQIVPLICISNMSEDEVKEKGAADMLLWPVCPLLQPEQIYSMITLPTESGFELVYPGDPSHPFKPVDNNG
jgi:hypothetical protein